jgi:hypothetical protein
MKQAAAAAAKETAKRDRDLGTAKAERDQLEADLNKEKNDATQQNLQFLTQIAAEKKAKKEADEEKTRLQQELAKLQGAQAQAAAQTTNPAVVQKLRADLQAAEQEIAKLKASQAPAPAQAANAARVQQLQTDLQTARQEIANLKASQAQQGPANAAMIQQLQGDLQATQNDLAVRIQELNTANADYQKSQNEVAQLKRQIATLQAAAGAAGTLSAGAQQQAKFIYRLLKGDRFFTVVEADFNYAVTPDFIWHWVGVLVAEERELVKQLINTDAKEIREKREQILRYIWHNRFQITQNPLIWSTQIDRTGFGGGFLYADPGAVNNSPVLPRYMLVREYDFANDGEKDLEFFDVNDFLAFVSGYATAAGVPLAGGPAAGAAGGAPAAGAVP